MLGKTQTALKTSVFKAVVVIEGMKGNYLKSKIFKVASQKS